LKRTEALSCNRDMPKPRPPHLQRQVTRHGRTVWYVRQGKSRRIRIRATYGTPEFALEYQAALRGTPARPYRSEPTSGTLAWLIAQYRETTLWAGLSMATKRRRETIFRRVLESAGDKPFTRITQQHIIDARDRRAATPHQARHFLDAMRSLFRWAVKAQHTTTDPTVGVANLIPSKKSGGIRAWTEDDVSAYWRHWPIGTHERVWLDVMLFTGLRRGDAVRLGRQHVRDGIATLKTEKSQGAVAVTLPILPVLAETLAAGPTGDLTFVCGKTGRPFTPHGFGNSFKKASKAAGVPGSAHGVRKIAATTAAMNGATTEQLKALFGWTSDAMPSLYVKSANRARMARDAAHLLVNKERESIPSPKGKVRAPERN
jgi:integrase